MDVGSLEAGTLELDWPEVDRTTVRRSWTSCSTKFCSLHLGSREAGEPKFQQPEVGRTTVHSSRMNPLGGEKRRPGLRLLDETKTEIDRLLKGKRSSSSGIHEVEVLYFRYLAHLGKDETDCVVFDWVEVARVEVDWVEVAMVEVDWVEIAMVEVDWVGVDRLLTDSSKPLSIHSAPNPPSISSPASPISNHPATHSSSSPASCSSEYHYPPDSPS